VPMVTNFCWAKAGAVVAIRATDAATALRQAVSVFMVAISCGSRVVGIERGGSAAVGRRLPMLNEAVSCFAVHVSGLTPDAMQSRHGITPALRPRLPVPDRSIAAGAARWRPVRRGC